MSHAGTLRSRSAGTTPRWADLEGYHTRFGDVRPLLSRVDDRYVIMNAGGPSSSADMNKTVLRRGSTVVVKRQGIQEAFRSERTMSDIGARPGDELYVPTKPSSNNWQKFAAIAASVTGIVWSLVWITGRN